ncbi:hypothetical protein U5801_11620 [Lamprobacter modestohalophilus]|nr:hypothetical protein [Lamprobacter modestohalophilus]MEA1050453.1 hypothetical protein [Lamprobacter modestohalophilus]
MVLRGCCLALDLAAQQDLLAQRFGSTWLGGKIALFELIAG